MILSINQPAYLPWPGYFDRLLKSDVHIVLDHVQYEKNSLVNRNRIRTKNGWTYLTVPIKTKGKFGNLPIIDLEISDLRFAKKHLTSIKQNYSKASYYANHIEFFEDVLTQHWTRLAPLVKKTNDYFMAQFNIGSKIVYSSDLNVKGAKNELILSLCRRFSAKSYISGPFGRDYLDLNAFKAHGINVSFHDYKPIVYRQVYTGFEPYMSSLDLLLNEGPGSVEFMYSSRID